ncbi:hypothetical protein L1987_29611 [Smallanthus sonchifolius]|uniref:Uncharacterized protein n=1 Tax=Smallanthus sonchifolius TaxID=185202 RepID=A0ACB9HZZ2_9ASTR|nr:hypothetical protein L1987_29611 [Smallanthus sonchifolius]
MRRATQHCSRSLIASSATDHWLVANHFALGVPICTIPLKTTRSSTSRTVNKVQNDGKSSREEEEEEEEEKSGCRVEREKIERALTE